MQAGAVIFVFGMLMLGRGLIDVFRSEAVAASNRRRNALVESGRTGAIPTRFSETRRRHAESPAEVRRQGKNVLWFSAAMLVFAVLVMMLSGS